MGVAESKEPITKKLVTDGNAFNLNFGLCEMQGWRANMEDATIAEKDETANAMLFGVLDGHGGKQVSTFVAKFFSQIMKRLDAYRKENYEQALIETFIKMDELLKNEKIDQLLKKNEIEALTKLQIQEVNSTIDNEKYLSFEKRESSIDMQKSIRSNSPKKEISIEKVIPLESKRSVYLMSDSNNWEKLGEDMNKERKSLFAPMYPKPYNELNNKMSNDESSSENKSGGLDIQNLISYTMGTTANIIFIRNKVFYVANVGDSRAVLFKAGKAIRLNEEHKPSLLSEQSRISKSGFNIISNRIDGKLNLTRAIGDFMFKRNTNLKRHEQAVTVYPEINTMKITKDMEFLVIACDGVWDCVDDEKLCEFVWKNLREGKKISEIIINLFDQIVSKTEKSRIGTDNMSCIIVQFFHD